MNYTIEAISPQIDRNTNQQKVDRYNNKKYYLTVKDPKGQIYNFSKGYKGEPNKVGDTISGTLDLKDGDYGQYYQFTADKAEFGGSGGSKGGWKPQDETLKYPGFALSYAKDLMVAKIAQGEKVVDPIGQVLKNANTFLGWLQAAGKAEPKEIMPVDPNQEKMPIAEAPPVEEYYNEEPPF